MNVPLTIPAAAAAASARFGDAVALIESGRAWSFNDLYSDARSAASAFIANGIGRGDVIAIWAPNRREWILAALGAQMAGAAITPLNTRLKGREAGDILRRCRAKLLFSVGTFLETDYPSLIAHDDLPDLRARIVFGSDWDAFVKSGNGPDDPAVDAALAKVGPDDLSDIIFTSGTTGAPKGVLSTHGRVVPMFLDWAQTVDLRERDRYLIANPFFHTFGYKAGWVSCLLMGATMLPLQVFDVAETARLIEHERITFLPGPPTIFQSLLAAHAEHPRDFSSLRVAVTGSASVPAILVERMQRELGIRNVITGYAAPSPCAAPVTRSNALPIPAVASSLGSSSNVSTTTAVQSRRVPPAKYSCAATGSCRDIWTIPRLPRLPSIATAGCTPEISVCSMRRAISRSPTARKICTSPAAPIVIPPRSRNCSANIRPSKPRRSSALLTSDWVKWAKRSSCCDRAETSMPRD
jgi:acyl-CoA synthetase (AMP-forming)/AMP-acid ligase II